MTSVLFFGIALATFVSSRTEREGKTMTKGGVDLVPVFGERLSINQFLHLPIEQKNIIRHVSIIPPRLGRRGFGSIFVEYSKPVYQHMSLVTRRGIRRRVRR